jgi:hypothetical protein
LALLSPLVTAHAAIAANMANVVDETVTFDVVRIQNMTVLEEEIRKVR